MVWCDVVCFVLEFFREEFVKVVEGEIFDDFRVNGGDVVDGYVRDVV